MKIQVTRLHVLIFIACFLAFGLFRVYYGGGIGMKVVAKNSFSFTDTIVNLDDILGMPRIAVATKHPAVKVQLEKMGITESDDAMQDRTKKELQREIEAKTRDLERLMGKQIQ